MTNKTVYGFALLFTLFVWSCNSNTNNSSKTNNSELINKTDTTELTIFTTGNTMYDMAFDPNVVYAKNNTIITINLINQGIDTMMIHNMVIVQKGKADEIGVKALRAGEEKQYVPDHPAVVAASELLQPSDSLQFSFDAPPVGTYPFICTFPGHYLKMRGRLVVE